MKPAAQAAAAEPEPSSASLSPGRKSMPSIAWFAAWSWARQWSYTSAPGCQSAIVEPPFAHIVASRSVRPLTALASARASRGRRRVIFASLFAAAALD
jgi:hypothetical protein